MFIQVLKQANSLYTADIDGGWGKNPEFGKVAVDFELQYLNNPTWS